MAHDRIESTPERSSVSRVWVWLAMALGWLLLLMGIGASLVTVAGGRYGGVLRFAMGCAGVAVALLTFGFVRGRLMTRGLAVLGIGPVLFIVEEFLRRA